MKYSSFQFQPPVAHAQIISTCFLLLLRSITEEATSLHLSYHPLATLIFSGTQPSNKACFIHTSIQAFNFNLLLLINYTVAKCEYLLLRTFKIDC